MTLVLAVSNTADTHVPLVSQRLADAGHQVVRFDTDRVGKGCSISFASEGRRADPYLIVDDVVISATDVGSVWWRRPEAIRPGAFQDAEAGRFAEQEWAAAVHGVLRSIDALWVSHPESIKLASHKIMQLQLAQRLGLQTPATLVSADPSQVREFCERNDYRVVAKLVSGGPPRVEPPTLQYMVFTAPVTPDDVADDVAVAAAPAIYQRYVEKDYELRVTVVGDSVFACAIDSQATPGTSIDWRRYDLDRTPHRAVSLPSELREACLELTRQLGLAFSAIDLVMTPDGDPVFLEANPNGQWGWIEELTELPIAQAVAELLACP